MNRKILFFIWFGLIVFFSIVPNSAGDQSWLSKMALTRSGFFQHVFGYFVLSALAYRAFEKKRFWLYLVGIVLVGVLFEAVQYALPTRTFNVYDVVGNGIGVMLFVVIILRHDVDRKPGNALVIAKIEKEAGGQKSEVRGQRSEGHEIGYHYENLTTCGGDFRLAIDDFRLNLEKLWNG